MINTVTNLPPQILQKFNRFMLDPLYGIIMHIKENIVPLADKKIRPQDIGRRKEFDRLLKQAEEIYERKKI